MSKEPPAQKDKATRVRIRLKHALSEDTEINSVMPDTLEEFEEALAQAHAEATPPDQEKK